MRKNIDSTTKSMTYNTYSSNNHYSFKNQDDFLFNNWNGNSNAEHYFESSPTINMGSISVFPSIDNAPLNNLFSDINHAYQIRHENPSFNEFFDYQSYN